MPASHGTGDVVTTTPHQRVLRRALVLLLILSLATTAAFTAVPSPLGISTWVGDIAYDLTFACAGALALQAGSVYQRRELPWGLIGIGFLVYAGVSLLWSIAYAWPELGLSFTVVDALWAPFYLLIIIALIIVTRSRLHGRGLLPTLDALLVALMSMAVNIVLVTAFLNVNAVALHDPVVLVNGLFVLADLFILALLALLLQASQWRVSATIWLFIAGYVLLTIGDVAYLFDVTTSSYTAGTLLDLTWPVGALLIGLSAAVPKASERQESARSDAAGSPSALIPALAMTGAVVVLIVRTTAPTGATLVPAAYLAAMALLLGIMRLVLTVQQSSRLASALVEARIDPLTQLPNRRSLEDPQSSRAVLAMDIDDMAAINQHLGTLGGDILLQEVAARLRSGVRSTDTVLRSGGDEFAVILTPFDSADAVDLADDLISLLKRPFTINGESVTITVSAGVGVAHGRQPHDTAHLFSEATEALRVGRAEGPGLVTSLEGDVSRKSRDRLTRRAAVRQALEADAREFVPYFQPIVNSVDGSVLAAEALVRWVREGKVLTPAQFLPDVTSVEEMRKLSRRMLLSSLTLIQEARLPISVTVNIPPELLTEYLLDDVDSVLERSTDWGQQLIIEVTETAIIRNPDQAARVLSELQHRGVKIFLDDFGSGWSGLGTLRDLPINGLKLDATFVQSVTRDARTASIVRGIATVAEELHLPMVYEGVEDVETCGFIKALPASFIQGYVFARPMPITDLTSWYTTHLSRGPVDPCLGTTQPA